MPTTLIEQQAEPEIRPSQLRPGPEWASFEQFRMAGPSGPESVGGGQVGTLRTKCGLFRLIRDEDFQLLVGLASEAKRLQGGLTTMVHAAKVIRDHPSSPSAVELLMHLATEYGSPTASQPNTTPDAAPVAEDDEVIVDAAELKRRVRKR
jgi:hypothetical protein